MQGAFRVSKNRYKQSRLLQCTKLTLWRVKRALLRGKEEAKVEQVERPLSRKSCL